jgi:hypothetical protein
MVILVSSMTPEQADYFLSAKEVQRKEARHLRR